MSDAKSTPAPVAKIVPPVLEQMAENAAEDLSACLRPVAVKRLDTKTGETMVIPIPCGATQSAVCPACAEKARRLRMHQAREGWHLEHEPRVETAEPTAQQRAALGQLADLTEVRALAVAAGNDAAVAAIDHEIESAHALLKADGLRGEPKKPGESKKRKVRSTRRRQDVPDLPRKKVEDITIGRTYTAPNGKVFRPSTFLTLTLDSYGPVHTASPKPERPRRCRCGQVHHKDDGITGTPLDPSTYDYVRAARDAIHLGRLIDRFWQNLRRATGRNVQYFATVEPQKRLAMHLHAAVRGTIPRKLLREVTRATYHQVWWPHHDHPIYSEDNPPVWDEDACAYVDPDSGRPLQSWDDAIAETLEPDATPAHVVKFGPNGIDVQGVNAGTAKAGKCLGYLVKYLTKDLDSCYEAQTSVEREHLDRLTRALRVQPCSESCANWLLYGIQPEGAKKGLVPGACKGKAHRPTNLGYRGRRCLVSRKWSGRNLTEHKAERRDHVLRTLGAVGVKPDLITKDDPGGTRYRWMRVTEGDPQYDRTQLLLQSIAQRRRWQEQYERAKQQATELSATADQAA